MPTDEGDVRPYFSSKRELAAECACRVLIVDDDARSLETASLILSDFDIQMAGSGEEALRILRAGIRIDLLITCLDLDGHYDGLAVARQARALQPALRVISTSGYGDRLREDDFSNHDGDLLQKPFAPHPLHDAVVRALKPRRARLDAAS